MLARRYAALAVPGGRPSISIPLKLERSSVLMDAITVYVILSHPFSVTDRCDHFEVIFTALNISKYLKLAIFVS